MSDEDVGKRLALSSRQQRIFNVFMREPGLTHPEFAQKAVIPTPEVSAFFASAEFALAVQAVAISQKHRLVLPAIKALEASLKARSDTVRLSAAVRILEDEGVLQKVPTSIKQDNTFHLRWEGHKKGVDGAIEVKPLS